MSDRPDATAIDHGRPAEAAGGDVLSFAGLLFAGREATADGKEDRSFVSDLHLDLVVTAVIDTQEEPEYLRSLFYRPLHDADQVRYRQEVFTDLETPRVSAAVERFVGQLAAVDRQLRQLTTMRDRLQQQAWHLDAVAVYCAAVRAFDDALASAKVTSRGLAAFRRYLHDYASSPAFHQLQMDTDETTQALGAVRYCVRITGGRVDVARYDGEADYSEAVLRTFDRFRQGAVADYRIAYRSPPGINHITSQILARVARLFPEEFATLDGYFARHAVFVDDAIRRFTREAPFFLAYLAHIAPLRDAGLAFCRPEIATGSKEVVVRRTFDVALAAKLVARGTSVVTNDVVLSGPERIVVVTGPNQGGKTTFARTFGQLHHLASLGCPVPGSSARLALFDRLFTHFAREEDLARMSGKLEDDIVRVRDMLCAASPASIFVLNEVFSSTTLHDARFLGTKVLQKVMALDARCVYVTFVDELAGLGPSVVSVMSTVVPEDPARRTFEIVRRPADGLAHALAIADKHHVTYEHLRNRLAR